MNEDVYFRDSCRLCGRKKQELVVPFVPTPLGDAYVTADKLKEPQKAYPLDLYFCLDCGNLQMSHVVDPKIVFANYTYRSSASAAIVKHFSEYADLVLKHTQLAPGSLVVEIGANDGVLLKVFKQKGFRAVGVDPSEEIGRLAVAEGIEMIPEFFSLPLARSIHQKYGPAAIMSANNVFAHADDMKGMIEGIREILADDGLFAFEASYVVDVVEKMLLGAIFHEHLCHYGVGALQKFFDKYGLELIHVERVTIQGGSFIGFVQKKGGSRKVSSSVATMINEERARGFDKPAVYKEFSARINKLRDDTRKLLGDLKAQGKKIAGFGAARGGTTLVFHFGLADFLDYIVDDNPDKKGLFSPGVHIPVLSTEVVYEKKPDYLFLLAWVHAKTIMAKHKKYLDQGGHFVVAHPRLEVF